jgi:hypothetical protein
MRLINGFSRWVWGIVLILLLAIVGAIALGVVLSMGKEDKAPKEPCIIAGNTSKVAGAVETGAVGGGGEGGHGGVAPASGPGGGGPARGGGDALGPTTSRAILHVTPTHTIRALAFDTEGIVMPLPTGVAKGFGGVEALVQEKRNSSSEERRGDRRRGASCEEMGLGEWEGRRRAIYKWLFRLGSLCTMRQSPDSAIAGRSYSSHPPSIRFF